MTYSLDERATGSSDVAHKDKQKLRQPKLNQTALRAALATAQQEAVEAQRRLDELRANSLHRPAARTRRLARAVAEAGGETKGASGPLGGNGPPAVDGDPGLRQ